MGCTNEWVCALKWASVVSRVTSSSMCPCYWNGPWIHNDLTHDIVFIVIEVSKVMSAGKSNVPTAHTCLTEKQHYVYGMF